MIRTEPIALTDPRLEEVRAFVEHHPAATAYATPTWLSVMNDHMGVRSSYVVSREGARIVGVLPMVERSIHRAFHALPGGARPLRRESLGHDCYAGPLLASDLDELAARKTLRALVDAMCERPTVLSSIFPPAWAELDDVRTGLTELGFHRVRPYPIGVKPLAGVTEATLPQTYCKAHRNAAEAAKRRGVVVRAASTIGELLEFSDLLDETMDHAGVAASYSKDVVVEGGKALIDAGVGSLFLGLVDGRAIAGMFMLQASRSACYWLGATAKDERTLKHRPMNALLPHAFQHAIRSGREWFELGGLMTEGLRAFKVGWGAQELEQPTFERSLGDLIEPLRAARASVRTFVRRRLNRA